MSRRMTVLVLVVVGAAAALALALDPGLIPDDPEVETVTEPEGESWPDAADPGFEVIVDGLSHPWSVGWLDDGAMIFTERGGTLYRWDAEAGAKTAMLELDVAGGEGGLLGLATDGGFIYLYYTYGGLLGAENRVVRHALSGYELGEEEVLLEGIPGSPWHDGGRIALGPDGLLYVTTGDAINEGLAQDAGSPAGKILRMNPDGTVPDDNPFPGSYVYSMGHRNPQGLDWDAGGRLVITEHGPSGSESGKDEINAIVPGANYGWPLVRGDETLEGMTPPLLQTGADTWAPSGATFYYGDAIPEWHGKFVVAGLRGQSLYVVDVGEDDAKYERWYHGEFGRLRDAATGPDGRLYVLTDNGSGDRILAIPGS